MKYIKAFESVGSNKSFIESCLHGITDEFDFVINFVESPTPSYHSKFIDSRFFNGEENEISYLGISEFLGNLNKLTREYRDNKSLSHFCIEVINQNKQENINGYIKSISPYIEEAYDRLSEKYFVMCRLFVFDRSFDRDESTFNLFFELFERSGSTILNQVEIAYNKYTNNFEDKNLCIIVFNHNKLSNGDISRKYVSLFSL